MNALPHYSFVRNCWYAAGLSSEFPKEKLTGQVICETANGSVAHQARRRRRL